MNFSELLEPPLQKKTLCSALYQIYKTEFRSSSLLPTSFIPQFPAILLHCRSTQPTTPCRAKQGYKEVVFLAVRETISNGANCLSYLKHVN